jgi:hypothetical protein
MDTRRSGPTCELLVKQPLGWMMILTLTVFLLGATWSLSEIVFSKTGRNQLDVFGGHVYRVDTKTGRVEMFE